MKFILIAIVALGLLGGVGFYAVTQNTETAPDEFVYSETVIDKSIEGSFSVKFPSDDDPEPVEEITSTTTTVSTSSFSSAFEERVIMLAIEEGGRPIEGFDAFMLLAVFPGLLEIDFERVVTTEGHYEISDGYLKYVRDGGTPATSAEQTLDSDGYAILLSNIAVRSGIALADAENLEAVIVVIQTALSEIPIQSEFPEKVVYGDNFDVLNTDVLKLDCSERGGVFNTCGSVCSRDAEICTEQCALTCEFTDVPVF